MRLALLVSLLTWAGVAQGQEAVWVEGENAFLDNFNNHGWYGGDNVARDRLSPGTPGSVEGDWLVHYSPGGEVAEASYALELAEDGEYTFWVRANGFNPNLEYQIVGQPRARVNTYDVYEHVNILDGAIDIRFLSWFKLGTFEVTAGRQSLTFYVGPGEDGNDSHTAIDAVVAANDGWTPAGAVRPGAGPMAGPDTWFVYSPADVAESEIDVSHLVEAPAGARGALKAEGDQYVFADGTPVKFWGVGAHVPETPELMAKQAKFLRSRGINMVRLHPVRSVLGPFEDDGAGGRQLNPQKLDLLDRWMAALKAEGIYSTWSIAWFFPITAADGYDADLYADLCDVRDGNCDGVLDQPDAPEAKNTYAMVNISTGLQEIRWAYFEAILNHVNPHTGLKYAEEPALAALEVQNEDTIFWHNALTNLRNPDLNPVHSAMFAGQWADWVRARYETEDALTAAWGAGKRPTDSIDADTLDTYGAWEFDPNGPAVGGPAGRARMGDFIRFCTETQITYWTGFRERLRGAGFEGVVLGTAWKSGGPAAVAANLYADAALDAIDRHAYSGNGEGTWRIIPGAVNDLAQVDHPGGLLLGELAHEQVEDKPFSVTEWSQSGPNRWRAEMSPLFAYYGMGLQGWDASYAFAAGSAVRIESGWPGRGWPGPYVVHTPVYMGQFSALATAVHQGHIAQGPLVAARRATPDQILGGYDLLTQPDEPNWDGERNMITPSEVFAIGRVTAKYADGVEAPERGDWSEWDQENEVITSATGELVWNYGERHVEVRAPKSQGVIGFAGGDTIDLPDVSISLDTPFASLLITAMDDAPIAESGKILVTALAQDKQYGTEYEGEGEETRLVKVGAPPLMMEPVQASLTFGGEPFTRAEALDMHGRRTGTALIANGDGAYRIDGTYTTFYYLFEREQDGPIPMGDGGVTDAGSADGGTNAVEGSEDEGCGCDATDQRSGLPWIALLLFIGVLGRRRRSS